ncbi:hypothetical protein [Xenorhabdus sp. SGI246]|uniref:hypothetical protein n=1 Tax=Xenorhabdus sp. SGI246 TaxID=3158263 RepID=UPI00349FB714
MRYDHWSRFRSRCTDRWESDESKSRHKVLRAFSSVDVLIGNIHIGKNVLIGK